MRKLQLNQLKKFISGDKLAVLTVSIIILSGIYFFCQNFLELKAYDFLTKLTSVKKASDSIVTVVIDDQSIAKIGRWPWKRTYYADMFEYLEKYSKAQVIAFDSIIISYDTDTKSDQEFFTRLKKFNKVIPGVFFSKEKDFFNNDDKETLNKILKNKSAIEIKDSRNKRLIDKLQYFDSSYSLKEILTSASSAGSVLSSPDPDGIIRKTEPVYFFKGSYYPSLSLSVFSELVKNRKYIIKNALLDSQTRDSLNMPLTTSPSGTFTYIRWYSPFSKDQINSHKSYSAWKVLKSFEQIKNGQKPILSPDIFKNKIIVVGATATALKDIKSTPISNDYPGVDIQATIIDNILHKDFVVKPGLPLRFIILATMLLLSFWSVIYLQPAYSSIISALLILGYFYICYFSYLNGFALDVVSPLAFVISALTFGYSHKYLQENDRKKQIQKIMEKYVSKDVMTDILKNIEGAKLGGKRAEITILFADIRGFTTISETLEPEEVSSILNVYFSEMVPIIRKYNGTLNKFMGDALLAIFGAPIENKNHARMAVTCAVEMIDKVKELQQKWLEEGKPKIEIGIGINTGIAFVGNVGSEDRLEYTVIGDTVNIASRLENFNKLYNTNLLISSSTYEKVNTSADVIRISSVSIKGKSEPIDIYEVIKLTK